MHFLTAALSAVMTVLFGVRTGQLAQLFSPADMLARFGVVCVFATVSVGFFMRGLMGEPFLWFHWIILASVCVVLVGYAGVHRKRGARR